MARIERFYPEDTVAIDIEVWNLAGVKFDPTSVQVTIYDPDDTAVVDDQAASNDDVGEYHYDYTIPAVPSFGKYTVKIVGTDGSRVKTGRDIFEVVEF